jgi:hypothetical protein
MLSDETKKIWILKKNQANMDGLSKLEFISKTHNSWNLKTLTQLRNLILNQFNVEW